MYLIPMPPEDVLEVSTWSNGSGCWLVITKNGEWIHHSKITERQVADLRTEGIEHNFDPDMSNPE